MLKKFKQATLRSLKTTGVSTLIHNSRWRRQRLLILAYHGVSLDDEHTWNGAEFMSADFFRARLQSLKSSGCAVLPLDEGIKRLYENDLPDRSVAITFDDGTVDFGQRAFPLLQEFGFPATLYLTTFYSEYQKPVFDLMCSYLLWKGRHTSLDLKKFTGHDLKRDLRSVSSQEATLMEMRALASAQQMSADEKDGLMNSLAAALNLDYQALLDKRIMHNLSPAEVKQLAAEGVDVQLHTHRHRTPMDRQLFLKEIEDNRQSIQRMTGTVASHFCYPSGQYDLAFLPWLREAGVVSATTCEVGLASADSNPLLLPRLIDVSALSAIEFEGWLSGVSAALPRRRAASERVA